MATKASLILRLYGYDLLLGSIAAFYVLMVPFTKVKENFNIQATHDILYHQQQLDDYDYLEFPGVVPRTFIGNLDSSKFVRLALGSIVLSTLRFFRIQVREKFGHQVEVFFCHMDSNSVSFAVILHTCSPQYTSVGYRFLLQSSLDVICCYFWALLHYNFCCIGLTILVDSVMWKRLMWPEFEVLWFNSVLNRSSEWGTHSLHWYFTSALPRSLFAAYPLFVLGVLLDRRVLFFVLPVFSFIVLYSKLPHKVCLYIGWDTWLVHIDTFSAMNGISRFCENDYPWRYSKEEGIALDEFHHRNFTYLISEHSAVDGFECLFSVNGFPRAHLQLGFPPIILVLTAFSLLPLPCYSMRFSCFLQVKEPKVKEPKVYVHGTTRIKEIMQLNWPGCS